jgi:hypothetical protein
VLGKAPFGHKQERAPHGRVNSPSSLRVLAMLAGSFHSAVAAQHDPIHLSDGLSGRLLK